MNSNDLAKKLVAWFNENRDAKQERDFGFRFRGRESFNYLQGFPSLIQMLKSKVNKSGYDRLIQVFYQSFYLRHLVSFSVRIENIDSIDIPEIILTGKKLFTCCSLHDTRITPSLWNFSQVAPQHCKDLIDNFNLGLGINSMEGREQKHQQIRKYSENTTVQQRWNYIFRHEFIQLVYLRENGFDKLRYKKQNVKYVPDLLDKHCECSLPLLDGKCQICDCEEMKKVSLYVTKNLSFSDSS